MRTVLKLLGYDIDIAMKGPELFGKRPGMVVSLILVAYHN